MPSTQRCVPQCLIRGGHRFPGKDRQKVRRSWILAIKRADKQGRVWKPSSSSVVCRSHFLPNDYISETSYGGTCQIKRLKLSATPSVFPWKETNKPPRRKLVRSTELSESHTPSASKWDLDICEEVEISSVSTDRASTSTQTDHVTENVPILPAAQPTAFSAERFVNDPKGMHCFTGLETYEKFIFVFNTLGPASYCLTYIYGPISGNICVLDRFFLVLIKLRRYYSNFELSGLFNITESDVYNIICTWIRYMSLQWKEIDLWPSQELVRFYCPSEFRKLFPTTRLIIDGTECPIKKPAFPATQQATFSSYKNRNTVKVLVGISPGGLCTYMSLAYGGSTSDRQLVERSALTRLCNAGDSVMSDKGFDVQDIFAPNDITMNIPTFFSKKKTRMSIRDVTQDRKIASQRAHVERVIGLAKTCKILTHSLNASETILSSDIILICFMLCNFRSGIVPRNA